MTTEKDVLRLAACVAKSTRDFICEMRPPTSSPGRPQCALFLTMAEQHEAALRLLQVGMTSHATVHVRSMQEAYADLRLLGRDEDHVRRMRYNQIDGARRLYERILSSTLLSGNDRAGYEKLLDEQIRAHEPLHFEFKKKRQTQVEAFVRADLIDLIGSYSILCSFAHNDLSALAFRHQGTRGMTHRAPARSEDTYAFTYLATQLLVRAAVDLENVAYLPDGRFHHHLGILWNQLQQMESMSPYSAPGGG